MPLCNKVPVIGKIIVIWKMLGVKINCNKDINVTEIEMCRMSQTSIMRFTLSQFKTKCELTKTH